MKSISQSVSNFRVSGNPSDALIRFLRADDDFLGIVLALTNLSQEKFLRILSAERFASGDYGLEWNIGRVHKKVAENDEFANRLASLFLEGRNNALIQQIADFYLAQLELPADWQARLATDAALVQNAIRRKLTGEYVDAKGKAVEAMIRQYLDNLKTKYGVGHAHGQVALVQKEVDFSLPSLDEPHVMIMSSYMETTSSNQTARANEQNAMYQTVIGDRVRYGSKRVMVNVVDGAGWLARRSDLRKMSDGCDYILSIKLLDQLESIICSHVPERFFVVAKRPDVVLAS